MSRGKALLFLSRTSTLGGGGGQPTRRPSLPPEKTRYPLYRRLRGPQYRSGRAENFIPSGIRSRTVQPTVSRYTNWATRPTTFLSNLLQMLKELDVIEIIPLFPQSNRKEFHQTWKNISRTRLSISIFLIYSSVLSLTQIKSIRWESIKSWKLGGMRGHGLV